MFKRVMAVVCLLSFAMASQVLALDKAIGWMFNKQIGDKEPVRVYIKDIINESGEDKVLPAAFKTELENSLHERRSIKFQVVDNPAESDIQVSAIIKSYQYRERGPLKPTVGSPTALLDAAASATQNYADMEVDYRVADTKTGKMLWQGIINEYLKKKMTPAESIPLVYDAVTRAFIWRCFGKANLRDSTAHDTL